MSHDLQHLDRPPPGGGPDRADPLARALAGLDPAPPALNRDRLMFAAGASSRVPVIRLWQLTAGVLAAVGFAAGLSWRSPVVVVQAPEPVAREVTPPARPDPPAERPEATPEPPPPAPAVGRPRDAVQWLRFQSQALTVVLNVLPDWNRRAPRPPAGAD